MCCFSPYKRFYGSDFRLLWRRWRRTDLPAPRRRWVWRAASPRGWTPPTSGRQTPTRQTWWRSRPRRRTLREASAAGSRPVWSGNTHWKETGNSQRKWHHHHAARAEPSLKVVTCCRRLCWGWAWKPSRVSDCWSDSFWRRGLCGRSGDWTGAPSHEPPGHRWKPAEGK